MTDDKKNKKIEGVKDTKKVQATSQIDEVTAVDKIKGVGKVEKTERSAALSKTRLLNSSERAQLYSLITEESTKLFKNKIIPNSQKEIIESAVKQVIDASIIDED